MALVQYPEPRPAFAAFEAFIDSGLNSDFQESPKTVTLSQELPDLDSNTLPKPDARAECLHQVVQGSGHGIDIDDIPVLEKYLKRQEGLSGRRDRQKNVPYHFPTVVRSPSIWSESTACFQDFVYTLSEQELEEIGLALFNCKLHQIAPDNIGRATFELPRLGPRLRALSTEVHCGKGVVVIRGLRPEQRCLKDNILLFAGIASHIADQRGVQGREHDYLIHLRDAGSHVVPNHLRPSPFANQAQAFHTDSCDVIGMYVMETAKEGGQSYWASSGQVYNELAASRPDIIHTLAASNWPFERAGSEPPYALRALLHPSSHQPILCFSRSNLTGTNVAPRSLNIPQLSEIQAEALDALHYCAEKHAIGVKHRKGDMYFLNNLAVLHGRASFVDHDSASPIEPEASDEEPRGERHLMRLWLRDTELGWQIPNGLETRWSEVFGKEVRARGKWSFGKVHSASLVMKSQNDETSSFS